MTSSDALRGITVEDMVRRALGYIARTGPSTAQDRWEENEGINPFTSAVTIAALVAGAALLPAPEQDWALALADFWNAQIEAWTTVSGTALARQYDIPGYYLRVAPPGILAEAGASSAIVPLRNHDDGSGLPGDEQIGNEFQQLVRFGLRAADDPLIQGSLRLADALLRSDTPAGPVWHRYRGDGYGEHADGTGFNGTGIGRGWPLLTGERGHYELCAGNDPLPYLEAMAAMASPGGMIPEQVWDADPIPERFLFPGRPTGSAMPLAWAHAEFVKLLVSRGLGRPFDRPRAVWQRYRGRRARGGRMRRSAGLPQALRWRSPCPIRASCIGAATAGRRSRTPRPPTPGSGFMSRCWRAQRSRPAAGSTSPGGGRMAASGWDATSPCACSPPHRDRTANQTPKRSIRRGAIDPVARTPNLHVVHRSLLRRSSARLSMASGGFTRLTEVASPCRALRSKSPVRRPLAASTTRPKASNRCSAAMAAPITCAAIARR